jgi:hypothetical protein
MSTLSKFAVTTTLALGAWIGLVGLQVTSAGIYGSTELLLKHSSNAFSRLDAFDDSLQAKFEPDPSDPPVGTGGTGSR